MIYQLSRDSYCTNYPMVEYCRAYLFYHLHSALTRTKQSEMEPYQGILEPVAKKKKKKVSIMMVWAIVAPYDSGSVVS